MVRVLKKEWEHADKDKSGTLTFKEVLRLLDSLNIKMKEKAIKMKFKVVTKKTYWKEVDKDQSKHLDFNEFKIFLNRLVVRKEIDELFHSLLSNKEKERGEMSPQTFQLFLKRDQKVKLL